MRARMTSGEETDEYNHRERGTLFRAYPVVSSYLLIANRASRLDTADIHRTFYALSR